MMATCYETTLTANNDAVKMLHVTVGRHLVAHVKWIALYNKKFWAFPEFIITPSLVVKSINDGGVWCGTVSLMTGVSPRP